jgi:hypothetical protein
MPLPAGSRLSPVLSRIILMMVVLVPCAGAAVMRYSKKR